LSQSAVSTPNNNGGVLLNTTLRDKVLITLKNVIIKFQTKYMFSRLLSKEKFEIPAQESLYRNRTLTLVC